MGALAVAFFVFLALSGDEGGTAAIRATVVPSATSAPISPTPAVSPTPDLYGVPVRDLALGPPVTLPAGVVMYYTWANIEGPSNNLWRAYRTASGELKMEDLFKRMPEGQPFTIAFDFEHGRLAVGVCIQSYCGGYGAAMPDSKAVLVTSEDGGATWTVGPALPVGTFLVGYTDRGLLMGRFLEGPTPRREFEFYPSGEPLHINEGNGHAFVSDDGEIVIEASGRVLALDGTSVYAPPALDVEGLPRWLVDAAPWSWSQWSDRETANSGAEYWGEREGTRFTRVLRWRGPYLGLIAQLDSDHFLGRLDDNTRPAPNSRLPVEIDLKAGLIHPLSDFVDPGSKYFVPYRLVAGTFAAARPAKGTCLNLFGRMAVEGSELACVPDGQLLKVLPVGPAVEGAEAWVKAELFDGRIGWVRAEFIEQ